MTVFIAVAVLVVIGLAVALCLGGLARMSVQPSEAVSSAGGHELPDGVVHAGDVDDLRFDTALRGYRMDQVDAALERLRRRIAELEGDRGRSVRPVEPPFGLGGAGAPQPVDLHPTREAGRPRLEGPELR
ncbi:DivIVA domain-containing protein [Mobilicoccus massiliensis]|uniref:DivIVA domain-containing protein n=1 Tax=Mobilicoccus massiliensis TaxID=1522310 RepID=UPI0006942CD6|nr:DivIVA domain-containing protein [Mobilicoccus massiliensis]